MRTSTLLRRNAMGLLALLGVLYCSANLLFAASSERGHVWTTHVFPQSAETWDWVHTNGLAMGSGGIWRYDDNLSRHAQVQYILSQPKYERLADMSCSVGIQLEKMQRHNPGAEHFGSDISRVMVDATRRRCPQCHAAQFDLGHFREAGAGYVFPGTFDYVIVSDVLIYIGWGGWPPIVLRYCAMCRTLVRPEQRRWLERVTALTRREIVFSPHQENPIAIDMLQALGAQRHAHYDIFIVNGTAARDALHA